MIRTIHKVRFYFFERFFKYSIAFGFFYLCLLSFIYASVSISNAGRDTIICNNAYLLNGNVPNSNESGVWTLISGTATLSNQNNFNASLSNIPTGSVQVLVWRIIETTTLDESRDTIIIQNNAVTIANAGLDKNICSPTSNSFSLNANNPSFGTGMWSLVTGSANLVNPNSRNSTVNGFPEGIHTLRWTISNANCSSQDDMLIRYFVSNAGSNQTVCADTVKMLANTPIIGTGTWNVISGSGDFDAQNDPQSIIRNLGSGNNSFQWLVIGNCVASSIITINNQAPTLPNAGIDQSNCSNSFTLSANAPIIGTGTWSLVSGSGNIAQSSQANTNLSQVQTGNNAFRWTISNGSCSKSDTLLITNGLPSKANAGIDIVVCTSSVQLNATVPLQGIGNWSVLSGSGSIVQNNDPTSLVQNITTGNNILIWSTQNSNCPNSYDTLLIEKNTALTANAGLDKQVCSNAINLNASLPSGTGTWVKISGSGVIQQTSSPNSLVTGLQDGVSLFEWKIDIAGCGLSKDTVSIDYAPITNAYAGTDVTICQNNTIISAANLANGTGRWKTLVGTGIIQDSLLTNTTVSNLSQNLNQLEWQVKNRHCISKDTLSILNQKPSAPFPTSKGTICSNKDTLKSAILNFGTGIWTSKNTGPIIENTTSPMTKVSNLNFGQNTFYRTVSNGTCILKDSVQLFNGQNGIPNAGNDTIICQNFLKLKASIAINGIGIWSIKSGSGIIGQINNPQSNVSLLGFDKNVLYWTIENSFCPKRIDSVFIFNHQPSLPNAGSDTCIILNTGTVTAQLFGNTPNANTNEKGFWTVKAPPGNIIWNPQNPQTTASGMSRGTYRLFWNIQDATSSCTNQDSTIVNIIPKAQAGPDICLTRNIGINSLPLTLTSPLTLLSKEKGAWNYIESSSSPKPTINSATGIINAVTSGTSIYEYQVSNNYPFCVSKDSIRVTFVTKALAGTDQCIVGLNSATVQANSGFPINTSTGGRGVWRSLSPLPTIVNYPIGSISGLPIGENKFVVKNFNAQDMGCFNEDTVLVTVITKPNAGVDAQILVSSPLFKTSYRNSANSAQRNAGEIGVWSVATGTSSGVDFDSLHSPTSTARNLKPGINELIWTITRFNELCAQSDTVKILVLTKATALQPTTLTTATPSLPLTTMLKATNPIDASVGEIGTWSLISSTNVNSNPTFLSNIHDPNIQIGNLYRGNHTFRWSVKNINQPSDSSSVDITLTVLSKAVAGSALCFVSVNDKVIKGPFNIKSSLERYLWTSTSTQKGLLITHPILADSITSVKLQNIPYGITKLYLTITNVKTNATDVDSLYITNINQARLGSDSIICQNQILLPIVLGPNSLLGDTATFGFIKGKGLLTGNRLAPLLTNLDTSVNQIEMTISNGTCASKDTINIKNNAPKIGTITAASNTCFTSNAIEVEDTRKESPSSIGKWTILTQPLGNSAKISDSSKFVTNITNMNKSGTYSFQWTITSPGCASIKSTFTMTRDSILFAEAGNNAIICDTSYIMKAAPLPSTAIGTWQLISGGGIIDSLHLPSSRIRKLATGTSAFEWTVQNGSCLGRATVLINRYEKPSQPSLVPLIGVCETDSLYIRPSIVGQLIGNPIWKLIEGRGKVLDSSIVNTRIKDLAYGENKLKISIYNGPVCIPYSDTIRIVRSAYKDTANAGTDILACGPISKLNAKPTTTGQGFWTVFPNNSVVFSDSLNPKTTISIPNNGDFILKWYVKNGFCLDSSQISLKDRQDVSIPNAGADSVFCDSSSIVLYGNVPLIGTGTWQLISGNGEILQQNQPSSIFKIKDFRPIKLAWNISKDFCKKSDTINIITENPKVKAMALADTQFCGSNCVLKANIANNGFWKLIGGFGIFDDSTNPSTTIKRLFTGTNKITWTLPYKACKISSDTVILTNLNPSTAVAGPSQTLCIDSTQLLAEIPVQGKGTWNIVTGVADLQNDTLFNTKITHIAPGTLKVKWQISNATCPVSENIVVIQNNHIKPLPSLPEITTFNSEYSISAPPLVVGNGHWKLIAGSGSIDNPSLPQTTVRGITSGKNIFRWTVKAAGCDSSYTDQVLNTNQLLIPNAFSPNTDGYNQKFEIVGLNEFPNSSFDVFDRWGNRVYENNDYKNQWEGKNLQQQELSDDTYYYILKLSNGISYKGFIVLKR